MCRKIFTSETMIVSAAIYDLIQSSSESAHELGWDDWEQITNLEESSQDDNIYYGCSMYDSPTWRIMLGNDEICTPAFVSEFARIYSLPTHTYNHDVSPFRRYTKWLSSRNKLIQGFTKHNGNYYMVADKQFGCWYSLYGFCPACGVLRCSPVWCICGHKELSNGWTSDNKQLDEFIKKSQLQTNSPNHAYLEWIPWDCIDDRGYQDGYLDLPIGADIALIPLKIMDETDDSYYDKVTIKYK